MRLEPRAGRNAREAIWAKLARKYGLDVMPSDVKSSTESIDSADNPPKRVAVVDIGATAIRMAIAEIHESGEIRTLDTLTQAVTLGKDTFTTNSIDPATTEQCVRVLKSYRKKLREFDIARRDRIHVVATSAVREASNRHSFLERIYVATGFRVEPFDEAGVNRVMYMGVQPLLESRPELAGAQALIIEVGGGSTEVLLIHAGDVAYANIHRLGALRARKTLESVHAPATKVREIMEGQIHRIVAHVRPHVDSDKPLVMITLGGDVRFAASELLRVDELPALATIPLPRFRKFTNDILALSVDELVHKHRLPFPEAEAVGPALLAYAQIAKALGLEAIHVSTISLRDGLIKAMATHEAWTTDFAKQIIRSAIDVGRRFKFDEAHSLHVADLSQALFHALRNEHKLDSRCEIILHVAALLHDIGYVVNTRSHHKHSMYLIINGDLFGLSKRDVLLAALTARYHRRASPKPSHVEYASLDWVSRMNVAKMAAILRVADALDRSNTQRIKNITCSLEDGRLVISVPSADDLSLEQLAMQQKSTLFKEIFGVRVLLRNAPEL